MAKTPTLTDIRNLITANHSEVQVRLEKVEEQVRLTNGRVKALETAEAVAKGIEEYKVTQGAQTSSNLKNWSSVLIWLIPLLVALAEAFIWLGKLSK